MANPTTPTPGLAVTNVCESSRISEEINPTEMDSVGTRRCRPWGLRTWRVAAPHRATRMSVAKSEAAALTEQVSPVIQSQVDSSVLNFAIGQPGPELLASAYAMIKKASAEAFEDNKNFPWIMQYGAECGPAHYREALAGFYTRNSLCQTSPSEVILTTGVSGGIQMMCSTLASPGDVAIVEQPSYFLARDIFASLGLETLKAPMTSSGSIDFAALSAEVDALESVGKRVRLLYVVPVHGNPTAVCKTREEKEAIVEWCERRKVYALCDEVYELLNFGKRRVDSPPMRDLSRGQHVVSLGSFSKICGPGLRLGWALASPEVVERFKQNGVLSSGGGLNPLGGAIMAKAMEPREGAEPLMDDLLLRNVCPTLSRKSRALCASIDRHLAPRGVTYARPEGGYFVFLRLPEGVDATELLETARSEFQVGYTPGERCLGPKNTARLSFAFYSEEEMELGVTRLAAALDNYLAG